MGVIHKARRALVPARFRALYDVMAEQLTEQRRTNELLELIAKRYLRHPVADMEESLARRGR